MHTAGLIYIAPPPVTDESQTHIGGRTVWSETILLLWQDPHVLAVLAEGASDDLQQYLASVHDQRDAPAVAAL